MELEGLEDLKTERVGGGVDGGPEGEPRERQNRIDGDPNRDGHRRSGE